MLSKRLQDIRILLIFTLLVISPNKVLSQSTEDESEGYDTTEYVPIIYKGALDYDLMIAASHGYTGEINRLILKGADLFAQTQQGATALIFAITNNQTKTAEMLIDYGSDPAKITAQGETALILAVKNQNSEIAEALIRAGADVDIPDRHEATPLHYASAYDFLQITDMLLYYDASKDKQTTEGSTPLLASVWAGNADVADLLIQNGADIEAKDNEGFTPFLMAALNGDTVIMQLLYKKGADIYAVNNSDHNALDLSIISGEASATQYLLKLGKWDNQGKRVINPYTVAAKYRRKDIVSILKKNDIPGNIVHKIDQVDISVSSRFFFHDIYSGMSLSFKEPYLNGGIIFGFDTKLWYTRVLMKQSEHTYYQYMDKGSVIYGGLFKDFSLSDFAFRGNYEISGSLCAGYRFGDELKGTLYSPPSRLMIIPGIGVKWTKKDLSFSLGAEYMNTAFFHTGPFWLRLGATYNLFFDRVRAERKVLKWY